MGRLFLSGMVTELPSNKASYEDCMQRCVREGTQQDSGKDMDANLTGRFLGIKYPDGDCDELVQRYYKKNILS